MTHQTKIKYAVLAEWLRSLEVEGFVFGIDKRLQLQELLEKLPEESTAAQLKLQLAPAIAQNEQEQDLVYAIFDRALQRVNAIHKADLPTSEKEKPKKILPWLTPVILLLALLSVALAIFLFNPDVIEKESTPFTKFFSASPNLADTICLDSIDLSKIEGLQLPIQGVVFCNNQSKSDFSAFGNYQIDNNLCLIYTAQDSLGQDSICIQLFDSKGDTLFVYFKPTIEEKTIPTQDADYLAQATTFAYEEYTLPTDIRSLEIEPLSYWEAFYVDHEWWLKPLFYFLTALLLLFILLLRERNRRQLIAETETGDQPPNIWNIEIGEHPKIEMDRQFDNLLNSLRQRTTADQQVLDLPKTIQSTIGKGGIVDFQYRFRTRPPEYLLLIDRQSQDDHRAQWHDYLYHQFDENEVLIERFFYNGDPRLCWNEIYTDGIQIKDLQQLYPEARLMLMSNGYALLNPLTGKTAKWVSVFELWKERAIFSPIPSAEWGRKERLLEENFIVLPDSLQALQFFVNQLELGTESEFGNWTNQVDDAPKYSIQIKPELGNVSAQLTIHYDETLVKWIAACAVYPSLHWDLTMYLGDLLSSDKQTLLTSENITQLHRLSWFRVGEMPDDVRSELLDWMEKDHPDTLQKVREGLHELLQQNPPPSDSIAWEDYHLNTSFNEWLITTDNKRKKQLEREIATEMEKGAEPDFTVVKYLNRPNTPLDFIVPDVWKKYVYNGGFNGLGVKGMGSDLFWAFPFWLAACILIWWIDPPISQQCSGDIVFADLVELNGTVAVSNVIRVEDFDEEVPDFTNLEESLNALPIETLSLCIDEPSDRILLGEFVARFSLQAAKYERVDTVTQTMLSIYENIDGTSYPESKRKADSLWAAYRRNLSVDYWNLAVPYFEQWDSLSQEENASEQLRQQTGIGKIGVLLNQQAAEAAKDTACFFFIKAWQLDSLNDRRLQSKAWCEDKTYNIQIYIASREQSELADQLFTVLKEKNYNISAITIDENIKQSSVVYFYPEDEAIANSILNATETEIKLTDKNLILIQDLLADPTNSQLKGNIRINLASDITTLSLPPSSPSTKPKTSFTVALYSYQQSTSDYQRIDQFLRAEGYQIFESTEIKTPFTGMANNPSIFYYSRTGQTEAIKLANELEKVTRKKFSVRSGAGQIDRRLNKETALVIHFIGQTQTETQPLTLAQLVRQALTDDDATIRSNALQQLTEKYGNNTEAIQSILDYLEPSRRLIKEAGRSNALKFLSNSNKEAWSEQQVEQGRKIADQLQEEENRKGSKLMSPDLLAFIGFLNGFAVANDEFPPLSIKFPIDLYFDYDEPNAKNNGDYGTLYRAYLKKQQQYVNAALNSPRAVSADQLKAEVDQFFNRDVKGNYELFQRLLSELSDYLQQGYELQICIQASVDGSGASATNQNLADRRIQSVWSYMENYNKGTLSSYLRNGKLTIQELPVKGVDVSEQNIQLNPSKNIGQSSYNLTSAQNQKVSIVNIRTKGDNCDF